MKRDTSYWNGETVLEMGFTECILLSPSDISNPRICTCWLEYKICMGPFVCYSQRWKAVRPAFPSSGKGNVDEREDVRNRFTFSSTLSLLNRQ